MIETTLQRWHQHLRGELEGGLDVLLHDDCVFLSPIVFTPQRGKELTKLYLNAAGATFSAGAPAGDAPPSGGQMTGSSFHYVKEVAAGRHAVLEFETEVAGTYVNGVDIIAVDDDGLIVEFKVMIRPLKAINLLHAQMKAMLEKMQG